MKMIIVAFLQGGWGIKLLTYYAKHLKHCMGQGECSVKLRAAEAAVVIIVMIISL